MTKITGNRMRFLPAQSEAMASTDQNAKKGNPLDGYRHKLVHKDFYMFKRNILENSSNAKSLTFKKQLWRQMICLLAEN